jgi:hypothetical protein
VKIYGFIKATTKSEILLKYYVKVFFDAEFKKPVHFLFLLHNFVVTENCGVGVFE